MKDDLYDEVSRVAFELHEQRGRMHGYDMQDWFEAEKIVLARREKGTVRENASGVGKAKRKGKKTKKLPS